MGEQHGTGHDGDGTRAALPAWAAFVITAVVWPLLLQLLILVPGAALSLGGTLLSRLSAVVIPLAVMLVGWWIGGRLRRAGFPAQLWLVPVGWAVVAALVALFGFFLSDTRDAFGLFGVLGSYVLGALGFWLGTVRARS